jgi:hypothetical protein
LKAFENRMLRKIFRPKMENRPQKDEVTGKCKNCIIWNLMKLSTLHMFLGSSNEGG